MISTNASTFAAVAFGEPFDERRVPGRFQQRHAVPIGMFVEPVDRLLADAARRRVDGPLEGDVVARIVHELAVGEHVLDFLAGVKLLAANHLVRHAAPAAAPARCRATAR